MPIYEDLDFQLYDAADYTKRVTFDVSPVATGTNRTIGIPNASGSIALTDSGGQQDWTCDNTFQGAFHIDAGSTFTSDVGLELGENGGDDGSLGLRQGSNIASLVVPALSANAVLTVPSFTTNILGCHVVNQLNQTGNISATTITSTAGFYLVVAVLEVTTADAGASLISLQFNWTDDVGATSVSVGLAQTATGRTVLTRQLYLASGDLTYQTNATTHGSAVYAARIRAIPLG